MTSYAHAAGQKYWEIHFISEPVGVEFHLFPVFTGKMSNGLGRVLPAGWVNTCHCAWLPALSLCLCDYLVIEGGWVDRNWTTEVHQVMGAAKQVLYSHWFSTFFKLKAVIPPNLHRAPSWNNAMHRERNRI